MDCDTIYFSDVLSKFRALPSGIGASFYFKDERPEYEANPIFSYIELQGPGDEITNIKEKVPISNNANTGGERASESARSERRRKGAQRSTLVANTVLTS